MEIQKQNCPRDMPVTPRHTGEAPWPWPRLTLVQKQIQEQHPQITVELEIIKTTGDKIQDVPLAKIGGKGLFTKEIEMAILAGEVDLGVHSMKDVPTEVPEGLVIGITTVREDPRDAFISRKYQSLKEIPAGGRIGTGSLRRKAQLMHLRPDLEIVPLRGNVDTRLRKLVEENLDAPDSGHGGPAPVGTGRGNYRDHAGDRDAAGHRPGGFGTGIPGETTPTPGISWNFWTIPKPRWRWRRNGLFWHGWKEAVRCPLPPRGSLQNGELVLEGLIGDLTGARIYREQVSGPPEEAASLGRQLAETLLQTGRGADFVGDLRAGVSFRMREMSQAALYRPNSVAVKVRLILVLCPPAIKQPNRRGLQV